MTGFVATVLSVPQLPCRFCEKTDAVQLVLYLTRLLSKQPLHPLQPAAALKSVRRAFEGARLKLPSNELGGSVICFGKFLSRVKERGGPRKVRVTFVLAS